MRIDEPLRAGVVEVRQRALPERLRSLLIARNGTLRISRSRLVHPLDPFRRVEPPVAQFDKSARGLRDRGRAGVPLVVGRGYVRRQAGRERERLEGRARRVARVVALPEPRAETERPELVKPAVQDPEGRVVVARDRRSADDPDRCARRTRRTAGAWRRSASRCSATGRRVLPTCPAAAPRAATSTSRYASRRFCWRIG